MSELTIKLDDKMEQSMDFLMKKFGVTSKAELISKGIAMLKVASHLHDAHGELYARKDGKETIIKVC